MEEKKEERKTAAELSYENPAALYSRLDSNLATLEKCKTLSKEDLNGKYNAAYRRLLEEIQDDANEIIAILTFRVVVKYVEHGGTEEELASLFKESLNGVLYNECSFSKFFKVIAEMVEMMEKKGKDAKSD